MKTLEPCIAEFSPELLERMASGLKALAHPCRLKIVDILQREAEVPVHTVMAHTNLPQATVSQHLNLLRRAGLVKASRKGKEVWYSIADASAITVLDCMRRKQAIAKIGV